MTPTIDLKALQGFIDETFDSLQDIESAFIRLETDPSDQRIIDQIFRPVHSMKGNSGFFGLTNINNFAHRLENLLDFIRGGQLTAGREIIDVLLTGLDFLRKMLERASTDPADVVLRPEEEQFLRERVEVISPEKAVGSFDSVGELQKLLAEAKAIGVDPENSSLIRNILDQTERAGRDLRALLAEQQASSCRYSPEAGYFFQGRDLTGIFKPFGAVLVCLDKKAPVEKNLPRELNSAINELTTALGDNREISASCEELLGLINFLDDPLMVASPEYGDLIRRHLDCLLACCESNCPDKSDGGEKQGAAIHPLEMVGDARSQPRESGKPRNSGKSIRIDQDKLDLFANSVGELIINVDTFNFLRRQMEQQEVATELLTRFANTVTTLDEKVSNLQENIMDIRKVAVRALFQRFPRIVRDLSESLGKTVNLRLRGEETVIDKDLLEKIENPLVHLLRNSVDHGIENPATRLASGKSGEGSMILRAVTDAEHVIITLEDDGAGIDPAKIGKKAIEKGFLAREEAEKLSNRELLNLIFQPGFSAADEVSDLSGRGVGMDVVHSVIKECKGSIEIDSTLGRGTIITLKVPLTRSLVTKEALIVRCAEQLFAIPSEEIDCTVYPDSYLSLLSKGKGFVHEGNLYNVVDLNEFFYGSPAAPVSDNNCKVLVICKQERIAFLADGMYSHQKIVVRSLPEQFRPFRDIPGISGYTILGNEEIVLIVAGADIAAAA